MAERHRRLAPSGDRTHGTPQPRLRRLAADPRRLRRARADHQALVLLAYAVADGDDEVLGKDVAYRPDLEHRGFRALASALVRTRPSVLLARSTLHPAAARAWRAAMPGVPLLFLGAGQARDHELASLGILCRELPEEWMANTALAALTFAERSWTEAVTCEAQPARAAPRRGGTVALVGGGIVNLITALTLTRAGYEVTLYDAAPDPRSDGDWSAYGCTRGGDNARMFTLTEADNYNDKRYPASGEINTLLERPVSDGGWRISDGASLSPADQRWAAEYKSVPPWLARVYTADIFSFNREARGLWDALMRDEPGLFDGVGFCEGILRLYTDEKHFWAQVARQDRVGATRRVLTADEVAERHPALGDACGSSMIIGGIEVVGFTVNVHDFLGRLVDLLERAGADLRWSQPVVEVLWDDGVAAGLVTSDEIVSADSYVVSPGAYGDELLRGTVAHERIQGVLGVWLTVPNLEPRLEHSLKIARTGHSAEDSNVTVGHDRSGNPALIIGSGYGWTGLQPSNIDPVELEGLYKAVEDTAQRFFPRAHRAARESGELDASRRLCVRPWTSSSLGVFATAPARDGGLLIVTGGHNTGGFTQSPSVAAAVLAALRDESHPMHTLYHPERLSRLVAPGAAHGVLVV
jgi:glycine/D-amino acid oxidase-like deaminating enzyme